MRGGMSGTVAFGISGVPAFTFLPAVLEKFGRRYTEIRLRIVSGTYPTVLPMLRDGSIDFTVGPEMNLQGGEDILAERLFDNTRAIVCRHGHPRAGMRSLTNLLDQGWLLLSAAESADAEFAPLLADQNLPARPGPGHALRVRDRHAVADRQQGHDRAGSPAVSGLHRPTGRHRGDFGRERAQTHGQPLDLARPHADACRAAVARTLPQGSSRLCLRPGITMDVWNSAAVPANQGDADRLANVRGKRSTAGAWIGREGQT